MKFSIIVANYNNGKYLPELIASIEKQTYTDWELVIADDCSTDNSIEILQPYLKNPKIKLVQHPENKGAGTAFKSATDNATGEIIGMLGADDALPADALSEVIQAHQANPKASFIYTACYICDNDLQIVSIRSNKLPPNESLIKAMTGDNFSTFKRSAYERTAGFSPAFKRALDQDLWLKLEEVGEVVFIDKPLYYYRNNVHGISQHGNFEKAHLYHIKAIKDAYFRRLNTDVPNISKDRLCHVMRYYYYSKALFHISKNKCKSFIFLFKTLSYVKSDITKKIFWKIFFKIMGFNVQIPKLEGGLR